MNRRVELLAVTSFLLLAVLLRVWDLASLPPGFSDDELAHIRMTETVRQGDISVYYQVGGVQGRAGMYAVGNMFATELVGDGLFGYRILSFWMGLLALALLYAVARRLFGVPVALIALGAMSVNLRAVLLSRSVTSEAVVLPYVLLTLFCLLVALNVRRDVRFHTPNTLPFALLAVLFGASGYLHYTMLVLGPLGALFFLHLVFTHQPLSRRAWSAWVFVIVLATVVAMPYLISTLREPELSEPYILSTQRPHNLTDAVDGLLHAVGGVIWRGDPSPTHNLPEAALLGPAMAVLLLIGVGTAIRRWREPGYALLLMVLAAGVLTDAWVGVKPTFSANLVALPAVYILPGIGALAVWRALRGRDVRHAWQPVTLVLVVILVANLIAIRVRLFDDWRNDAGVYQAYHASLGYLAAYLDRTPDGLPVSMCALRLNEPAASGLTPRQMLRLMMRREDMNIRHSDCRGGLVLINAGAPMRFAFADIANREVMPPELDDWLSDAQPIPVAGLPDGSVLRLDVEQRVRDAGGFWDAMAPVFYMPDDEHEGEPVKLPVQLEQNLTFAGYEPRVLEDPRLPGGDPIVLTTYWRVDGPLPANLGIFAHLLAYPQPEPDSGTRVPLLEPWAEANSLDVVAKELRKRDIFVQVSYLWLSENLKPGPYALTVGAYTDTVTILDNHLDVLDSAHDYQPHGDRLLLGDIIVEPRDGPADTEG